MGDQGGPVSQVKRLVRIALASSGGVPMTAAQLLEALWYQPTRIASRVSDAALWNAISELADEGLAYVLARHGEVHRNVYPTQSRWRKEGRLISGHVATGEGREAFYARVDGILRAEKLDRDERLRFERAKGDKVAAIRAQRRKAILARFGRDPPPDSDQRRQWGVSAACWRATKEAIVAACEAVAVASLRRGSLARLAWHMIRDPDVDNYCRVLARTRSLGGVGFRLLKYEP